MYVLLPPASAQRRLPRPSKSAMIAMYFARIHSITVASDINSISATLNCRPQQTGKLLFCASLRHQLIGRRTCFFQGRPSKSDARTGCIGTPQSRASCLHCIRLALDKRRDTATGWSPLRVVSIVCAEPPWVKENRFPVEEKPLHSLLRVVLDDSPTTTHKDAGSLDGRQCALSSCHARM